MSNAKAQFLYGTNALQPLHAVVNAAAGASTDIVALTAGKKIRVLSYVLTCETASGTLIFKSDTTGITGTMTLADNGSLVAAFTPVGHFETASGKKLALTTVGSSIQGHITYTLV